MFHYEINFQRYETEYISRYKQFESRRPSTVKGEVTRSLSYNDLHSNGSTPRAGLLSTQLSSTLEPPLQRKRIVPYEKNHNIFTTLTVKEQRDRDWLKSDGNSHRSCSPNRQRKEVQCIQFYHYVFSMWTGSIMRYRVPEKWWVGQDKHALLALGGFKLPRRIFFPGLFLACSAHMLRFLIPHSTAWWNAVLSGHPLDSS